MDLRHLRHFVAVAEELHFSRAAARLGIGQPPLSQSIQALEAELGAKLFERTRRHVELTEPGHLLLAEAREILARTERAVVLTRRAARGEVGELRIGFTAASPFLPVVPRIIDAYRRSSPDVHLTLTELPSLRQLAALADGRIDVGFVREPRTPTGDAFTFHTVLREPLIAVLRADHRLAALDPVPLAELRDEPFVFYPADYGTSTLEQVSALCAAAGFQPRVAQEAREAFTIIGLIAAGLGVSILPAQLRQVAVEGVVYRSLDTADAYTTMLLAHRRGERSALVRGFTELVGRFV
ncbi:LysR family transcriptional regulator [Azospirillum sp.]|uniref:LysR family transcriptional regulator n=1 Tax=Azospirillum sp. TaxID=34012 RepID=UPI002D6AC030|nr:LysR substrate-binding domain-containing protein [Azospirillum sp.]HYD65937.1 LysR substrate-binding domain-containing protein [Azospirillum sp.]